MTSGFIVRFRPIGPWRLGPPSGERDRVDRALHSDTLFSALTLASERLGFLNEWLAATAESANPVIRIGSGFPFVGKTLLAPGPKHVWPPAAASRVRWQAARFVPLQLIPRLLAYESLKEDRWAVDPVSECVLPVEKFGEVTPPFRVRMRHTAPVDRLSNASAEAAATACLEFADSAGMWCAVACTDAWRDRVQSLFRYVADAGLGGERSLGWGRSAAPEFETLPGALTAEPSEVEQHETGHWLLSLYAPAETDSVDWSRGAYGLLRRSGRTDSQGDLKVESAMVEEGSVIIAEQAPTGFARNIAPDGYSHAVYRSGFAFSVPVLVRMPDYAAVQRTVEAEREPEPIEDAIAEPEPPEPSEVFEVETDPATEPVEYSHADGGAVEDATAEPSDEPTEDSQ